jgi:hypothetical protein
MCNNQASNSGQSSHKKSCIASRSLFSNCNERWDYVIQSQRNSGRRLGCARKCSMIWLTGIVEVRQSLQRSIVEHRYAARWQHSEIEQQFGKFTSLDWIDAWWLSMCAIEMISSSPKKVESRMHCNAKTSLSTSTKSWPSKCE